MAPAGGGFTTRRIAVRALPFVVVALAGLVVRTPLASAWPRLSLFLFVWIVADTMMLALIARTPGRPRARAILATLAGATMTVGIGAPAPLRAVLLESPVLAIAMTAIVVAHGAFATHGACRILAGPAGTGRARWTDAAAQFLPAPLVRLAAAELAVLHMALFRWGGPADVPAGSRAFAYHRHLAPMCTALLILSAIEMAVYHLLVGHWNRTAALVMFVLSDVGFVYLVGLIKSFRFRPVLLTQDGVQVRAGFLIDRVVPLEAIVAIDTGFAGEAVRDPATLNAALLAWPNVLLRLDRPMPRRALLRRRAPFTAVAFRLDDPEAFVRLLRWRLGQRGG